MATLSTARRAVIKIGSALLVDRESGNLRRDWLTGLAQDVLWLKGLGCDVVLVSSGSIALGRGVLGLPSTVLALEQAQAAAADAAAARLVINPDAPDATDNPGGYNDFWMESANIGDTVRTSHIVYPLNGRLPAAVEGAQRQYGGLGPAIPSTRPVRFVVGGIAKDGPEDRGTSERCIVGFNSGPPFTPSLYNNNVQILQSKDTAVIMTEMIHDARIVTLGDKPPLDDDIRLWSGDSRGWYEGDSLIVETKNFNGLRQTFSSTGNTKDLVLTEKFTRTAFDTVDYEFTIDDPSTFTDKITAIIPMTKVAGQLYEYACHEGNYGMFNILRGERMEERREAEGGAR